MSIILWIVTICYITVAVAFNLAMLSFWKEEKETKNSGWSGNDTADKFGMFFASACWPVCILWGLYKMRGDSDETR